MDNLLSNDLQMIKFKLDDIISDIEKYQNKHQVLLPNRIVQDQLNQVNDILDAIILCARI